MSLADVMVLGADGYLGWALFCYLKGKHYKVTGVDNFSRRRLVEAVGSDSLFPIDDITTREKAGIIALDLTNFAELSRMITLWKPKTIVHLAEQPSAPYSMRGVNECVKETQMNNICGTQNLLWAIKEAAPDTHLVKLGTMGEYSDWIYKGFPIPEEPTVSAMLMDPQGHNHAYLDIPTPRAAGSFYHWSKIFDSNNIEFACKVWGLRATDLNQGVVYGTRVNNLDCRTRFDYDSYFGTAVNRFVVQAVADIPLTVYGEGGQTRGFININDTMKAIELVIENPPDESEFRIVNQLTEVFVINSIARMVQHQTGCGIQHIPNPRVEKEKHPYNPEAKKLRQWGLTEPFRMTEMLMGMVEDVKKHRDRIRTSVIQPQTQWRATA